MYCLPPGRLNLGRALSQAAPTLLWTPQGFAGKLLHVSMSTVYEKMQKRASGGLEGCESGDCQRNGALTLPINLSSGRRAAGGGGRGSQIRQPVPRRRGRQAGTGLETEA